MPSNRPEQTRGSGSAHRQPRRLLPGELQVLPPDLNTLRPSAHPNMRCCLRRAILPHDRTDLSFPRATRPIREGALHPQRLWSTPSHRVRSFPLRTLSLTKMLLLCLPYLELLLLRRGPPLSLLHWVLLPVPRKSKLRHLLLEPHLVPGWYTGQLPWPHLLRARSCLPCHQLPARWPSALTMLLHLTPVRVLVGQNWSALVLRVHRQHPTLPSTLLHNCATILVLALDHHFLQHGGHGTSSFD